jgi:hypothetical protein
MSVDRTRPPAARVLWAGLDLLDRQLVDRQGRLCGKVDDLELGPPDDDGRMYVTAVHTGPGALLQRMDRRRAGRWFSATWRNEPVPIGRVADIGSHVSLSLDSDEVPTFALERWTRDHVVGHIPGSDDAPR